MAKFYTKMLLKGVILFLTLGVLFFFFVLGVEYYLWLNSTGRFILFLLFVLIELFLVWKFILIPLSFLFKWKRGLSNKEASLLIGIYFPEVDDKLYNLLDLAESDSKSELLLASIQQRSTSLGMVPFVKAINFKDNFRYVKYLLIPFGIFCLIWVSGDIVSYFSSYKRVVNYDLAYEPPAPFSFILANADLNVLDNEPTTLLVTTEGRIRPETMSIVINGKELLLQFKDGFYQYLFTPPLRSTPFYFLANGVRSKEYFLNVLQTPAIVDFDMVMDYPDYTNKKDEVIRSTGNAVFPEGTEVLWRIGTKATEEVIFHAKDSSEIFKRSNDRFTFSKRIFSDFDYELSTSNSNIRDYERLGYRFTVVRDAYPSLRVNQVLDSLNPNVSYYVGEATDDYLLSTVRLVYYRKGEEDRKVLELSRPNLNYDKFYYTFPSGLDLVEGVTYDFYFEVVDNDAIHKGKVTKSQVFSSTMFDDNQLKNKELEFQRSVLSSLDKSLEKSKNQQETLKDLTKEQKENSSLSFSDQNRIKDFLKQQQQQEELMKKFSSQLKDNLKKTNDDSRLNKLLQERIERQELEAKKNEKLLEELNRIAEKLDKEDLARRLEELGKRQKNGDRNLEQLLELTKRYYIQQKSEQLGNELIKLADRQLSLISEEFDRKRAILKEEQNKLGSDFDRVSKELDELRKDNASLKKPMGLKIDRNQIEAIRRELEEALEEIGKQLKSEDGVEDKQLSEKGKSKQKSAAGKMKEMAEDLMQSGSSSGGGSSEAEDAEVLRQLLDNLITFSFKQESLYNSLGQSDISSTVNSGSIRKQRELRELFKHVDDSLFALSLRQAEMTEFVNEQIGEVYYNLDRALESMAESEMYQGASYQKYVLNASNSLSDFLAIVLDNMQQNMSMGSGKGKGEGFQLPDIIMGQEKLGEKLGEMGKKGSNGNDPGEGEEGEANGNKQGKNGNSGKEGEGQGGEEGSNGKEGKGKGSGGSKGEEEGVGGEGGSSGSQGGPSEEELNEIYEIYKEQQTLREQLENHLKDLIDNDDRKIGEKLVRQMEDFQNDLLRNGVTQQSLSKMNNINREMLKLENAALKQGKSEKRESNRANDMFQNPILTKPSILENYRNEVEILNRQALPLQQNFQIKVKEYFRIDD
ncbi:hypothetical protein MWU78_00275 [Arenibacter sp. F26102]|uniref:hypothetical protein n=1 Tax=Arenibacter sp. F26102 TaxID=2926416 RepID=UPI001FF37131|nr:hypothetical protein [Arenibacter sp. F26102]MCK0144079.1 hypothetical protein [Arenibacter sp. F26102]